MSIITTLYERLLARIDSFVLGERDFDIAKSVLPFFYYLLFFSAFMHLEGLNYVIAGGGEGFSPRWPIFWAQYAQFSSVVTVILAGSAFSALIGAAFPLSRLARVVAFAGIFSYHAYMSSFGGPNHQADYLLWVAFIFIFLPAVRGEPSKEARRTFSLVFWLAQAYLLLTYSMAGLLKVTYGFIQALQGGAHAFGPDAGALHVASQLLLMHEPAPLARLVVENPLGTYPFFLAVLYIQFFAIVVAFRPQLHRVWGVALVLFHLGTFLAMRAVFTAPSVLLMALLLSSPFAPRFDLREVLRSLPLVPTTTKLVRYFRRR